MITVTEVINGETVEVHRPTTRWANPTASPMRVTVYEGPNNRERTFTIPAGESVEIPSMYDGVIHVVHSCEDPGCRRPGGGACKKPGQHGGVVMGGLAPCLVREGQTSRVSPSLIGPAPRGGAIAPADIAATIERLTSAETEEHASILAKARARRGAK